MVMKRITTILAVSLFAAGMTAASSAAQEISLRVMSMNIRMGGEYADYQSTPYADLIKVYDPDSFFTWDVCVVYPEQISPAMINELMQLKRGDRHSAIAFTRNTYSYVDV